ncbi:hypothetical protein CIHG_05700 [Coccidioides immitis H538.4]|uniref:Uncharacterized protein n=3 Tax=Coccidioides immitis TaxID=5501 RepID=A0A0J8R0X1_COCIT|nr:hypothetical protein CIRG_08482 [Coccidioides immitis RMSCC 2394]KMU78799.1 hypothetical protein CISG_01839 [Coccidioides immitis RMSCC 3703]KMU87933.1 hypothetical protein CIHG_05700 [Coccidioides immitis H538.4]
MDIFGVNRIRIRRSWPEPRDKGQRMPEPSARLSSHPSALRGTCREIDPLLHNIGSALWLAGRADGAPTPPVPGAIDSIHSRGFSEFGLFIDFLDGGFVFPGTRVAPPRAANHTASLLANRHQQVDQVN